jgi:hypothetical protein
MKTKIAKYHCAVCGDGFGESTKHLLTNRGGKLCCGKPGCSPVAAPPPAAAPVTVGQATDGMIFNPHPHEGN